MFKSKSVTVHLLRGIIGLALFGFAFVGTPWWATLLLIVGGALFLGGCPMCWALGLCEKLSMNRAHDQSAMPLSPPASEPVTHPLKS